MTTSICCFLLIQGPSDEEKQIWNDKEAEGMTTGNNEAQ